MVSFILVCISSIFISGFCIVYIGLNKNNRMMLLSKVKGLFAN
jgi:hypothetical protein